MSRLTTPTKPTSGLAAAVPAAANAADIRYHGAKGVRAALNKVFPSHWSFMLGEVALYSFIVLLLSGTYLTLFFDASMGETVYQGVYTPLRGVSMSRAFASTVDLSIEVRGGLLIRQIHHWAALIFLAGMMLHMARVFFTGAFRKPRELNWILGVLLLVLGMAEGFLGYSLPDDLLSGTGLRAVSAFILSIPVIGTWMHWLVFGGDYPGTLVIGRFYALHILLIPGIILALVGLHVALVWFQKHTQFPGPGRTENNVVGVRVLPTFAAKGGGFFAIVFGVIVAAVRVVHHQPGLDTRSVQPFSSVSRRPAGLLHGLPGRHGPGVARLGDPQPVRALHGACGVLPVDPGGDPADDRGDRLPVHRDDSSPRTTRCTTCCSVRGTCRSAPASASRSSRSTC